MNNVLIRVVRSRKFLVAALNLIVAAVLVSFVDKEVAQQVLTAVEPVFLAVIAGIALETAGQRSVGLVNAGWASLRDAFLALLKSRKFLLLVVDATAVVVVILLSPTEAAVAIVEQAQVLVTLLIGAIAVEDYAQHRGSVLTELSIEFNEETESTDD